MQLTYHAYALPTSPRSMPPPNCRGRGATPSSSTTTQPLPLRRGRSYGRAATATNTTSSSTTTQPAQRGRGRGRGSTTATATTNRTPTQPAQRGRGRGRGRGGTTATTRTPTQPEQHGNMPERVASMSTQQLREVVLRMAELDPAMTRLVMDQTPAQPLRRPAPGHPPPGLDASNV